MKSFAFFRFFFFSTTMIHMLAFAQNGVQCQWAKSIGSIWEDSGKDIFTDSSGMIYLAGHFQNEADFDPGPNTVTLFSPWQSAFFAHYDTIGNYLWAHDIATTMTNCANHIIIDKQGALYVVGYFSNSFDFDPGSGTATLTPIGQDDIFIAKYTTNGNYIWAKGIGSTLQDKCFSIAIDNSNNIYVTGFFSGTADFDPGAGVANLSTNGNADVFIAKYSSGGNYLWAKKIGGTLADYGYDITIDAGGNVVVVGSFQGSVDFDPGSGTATLASNGYDDIFIAKYDAYGNYLWARNIGGQESDYGYSLATDALNNIYFSGSFQDTTDFDPGSGTANLISNGYDDVFFTKFDSSGDYIWGKNIGSVSGDGCRDIVLDNDTNIFITGYFSDIADFDPSLNTDNLTSNGSDDIFIAKYNSSGNYLWASNIGSNANDMGYSITVGLSGNVYLTGYFEGTCDFDPGAGVITLSSVGGRDIFFASYTQPITTIKKKKVDESIKIMPNPNNGMFQIEINLAHGLDHQFHRINNITMNNVFGEAVVSIYPNGSETVFDINCGTLLRPGIYFLKIATNSELLVQKIILK